MANSGGNDGLERVKAFKLLQLEQPADGQNARKRVKATFRLIPKQSNYLEGLTSVISQNGGELVWPDEAESVNEDYTIKLLNETYYVHHPQENCLLPFDTFSGLFVRDAVNAFKNNEPPPNLNVYRLTTSKYQDFDANLILNQKMKWTDLEQVVNRARSKVTAQQVVRKFKEIWEWKKKQVEAKEKQCVTDGNGGEQIVKPANCESPQVVVASPEIVDAGLAPPVSEPNQQVETDQKKTSANVNERGMAQVGKNGQKGAVVQDEGSNYSSNADKRDEPKARAHRRRRLILSSDSEDDNDKDKGGQSDDSGPDVIPETPARPAGISSHAEDDASSSTGPVVNMGESISEESVHEEEDDDDLQLGPTSTTKPRRHSHGLLFTFAEGQRMLKLICKVGAYKYFSGLDLWKQLEESGQFPGRTYQSLKEHFRKKVLPQVLAENDFYAIDPADLARLKRGIKDAKISKHANVCPIFDFSRKRKRN